VADAEVRCIRPGAAGRHSATEAFGYMWRADWRRRRRRRRRRDLLAYVGFLYIVALRASPSSAMC